jgi:flagellar protein FliO/FliZ
LIIVVSFNLGGEKLKSSRSCVGVCFGVLLFFIGFFGVLTPLFPQTSSVDESSIILGEAPASQATESASSILIMLRMVLVLALTALAIYGVVFFIRRITRPRENPDPNLKVLARVPLSGDSFAAVISLGAKAWLVGGGSGGVNLISEVDDAESLETMLIEDARKNAETRRVFDFRSLLQFGRDKKKDSSPENNHVDSLRKQRERLKGL